MSSLVPKTPDALLPALPSTFLPAIASLTKALGIPRDFLASDEDIEHAWGALPRELKLIPVELRDELMARMCVAVSTGLFDGAMNYAWNAAILQLRQKIRNFGLPIVAQITQSDFEEKHLLELQDSRLLDLCLKLNLVDEDGYFFLDQCRDMRNNFSAAHPTLGKINDREFIAFLNRCVRYALADASSPKGVNIGDFISAVKGSRFTGSQKGVWVERLRATHDAQRQMLVGMVHGIYCDPDTPEPGRLNGLDLCTELKDGFTAALRSDLVNKHLQYAEKGNEPKRAASQQFFEKLGLVKLLNESERHSIFNKAVERLRDVHNAMNNFYNEPPFADRLLELSVQTAVPETIQEDFVRVVCMCSMGNGYGVCWAAAPSYESMIKNFSPREVALMVKLAVTPSNTMYVRLKTHASCRERFKQNLALIEPSSVPAGVKADYEKLLK